MINDSIQQKKKSNSFAKNLLIITAEKILSVPQYGEILRLSLILLENPDRNPTSATWYKPDFLPPVGI